MHIARLRRLQTLGRSRAVRAAGATVAIVAVAALVLLVADPAPSPGDDAAGTSARAVAAAAPVRVARRLERFTIGRSVRGRRIDAYKLGAPAASKVVLVVGCTHGNEPAGIAVARRLLTARPPAGIAIWVVPDLNPDGVVADSRVNSDLVDLNRNFPWHWRPLGAPGDLNYSGPRPLSEPESRAARALILRVRPLITIWFHQHQDLVDLSGGDPRIERRFASLVRLPVERLTRYPGSAVSWENSVLPGSTAFVVELPAGSLPRASVARYVQAILAVARAAR